MVLARLKSPPLLYENHAKIHGNYTSLESDYEKGNQVTN